MQPETVYNYDYIKNTGKSSLAAACRVYEYTAIKGSDGTSYGTKSCAPDASRPEYWYNNAGGHGTCKCKDFWFNTVPMEADAYRGVTMNRMCPQSGTIAIVGGPTPTSPFELCVYPQTSQNFISISGGIDAYPAGISSTSTTVLTAKVTSNGQPKSGITVRLSTDVIANSGGHEHHDAARPRGSLSSFSGVSDANGEFKVTFTSPEVSGIHKIKASCTDCANETSHEIKVKVPDLVPINPNPPRQADGSFAYALTSVDNIHQGSARYHVGQYWLTKDAIDSLAKLVEKFNEFGWGTVALNDASLIWGGMYDINGNWSNPHKGHRTGEEIDISFNRAGNVVPRDRQDSTYDEFCKKNNAAMPFNVLHHFVSKPHFHVYLSKQKPCAKTEK